MMLAGTKPTTYFPSSATSTTKIRRCAPSRSARRSAKTAPTCGFRAGDHGGDSRELSRDAGGSRPQLHEIVVRVAFAKHHPAIAYELRRHAEIANRTAVWWRTSVHCDFRSNEGHYCPHLAARCNRRKLHVALNQRLHGFDGRACASLGHDTCDILWAAP